MTTSTTRRRKATPAQQAAADERRAKMRELATTVRAMSDAERQALVERIGAVVTIERHPLSPFNSAFLAMQSDSVSVVGGFRQWIAAGRCVRKGERGMAMWIPIAGKKTEAPEAAGTDAAEARQRFTLATVFDITQTDEVAE